MEEILFGVHDSPFGEMVIGKSKKGLCWLGFMTDGYKGDGLSRMRLFFPRAVLVHDEKATAPLAADVIQAWEEGREAEMELDLRGTTFQKAVWKKLLKIPKGKVLTYGAVANDIGNPKASRAVGSAVGENPVSLIVPCHRVVPASGGVGNYGWGPDLKEKLLEAEGV